jgi:hypothetical protein
MIHIRLSVILSLIAIIAISGLTPALASSQLELTIDPTSDKAVAKMVYQRNITLDYSQGGKLADILAGKRDKISCAQNNCKRNK